MVRENRKVPNFSRCSDLEEFILHCSSYQPSLSFCSEPGTPLPDDYTWRGDDEQGCRDDLSGLVAGSVAYWLCDLKEVFHISVPHTFLVCVMGTISMSTSYIHMCIDEHRETERACELTIKCSIKVVCPHLPGAFYRAINDK